MASLNSKTRAPRNRTLTLSSEEIARLQKRLVVDSGENSLPTLVEKTILGDSLRVLPKIPSSFADLLIVDPPYNLSKNFNGNRFSAMSSEDYEAYLDSWMGELVRILKPEGSG